MEIENSSENNLCRIADSLQDIASSLKQIQKEISTIKDILQHDLEIRD